MGRRPCLASIQYSYKLELVDVPLCGTPLRVGDPIKARQYVVWPGCAAIAGAQRATLWHGGLGAVPESAVESQSAVRSDLCGLRTVVLV